MQSHAVGRRQASLGTSIPRTPTVAPGPKARPDLAVQGGGSRGSRRKREQEARRLRREDNCVQTSWPPSQAHNEGAWGSGDAHVQSTATRRPRPQAIRARGAPHLPLGFASKPSPSTPWARGLLSAFWELGSPDLPACGLQRGSRSGPVRPIFVNTSSRPSRGAKPRGADDRKLPQARPHQAGSRGGGEIKAGYLTRCP